MTNNDLWLTAIRETAVSYRKMIDATVEQLSDEEFIKRLGPEMNSVAVLLRHLGGNLISRWTNFLTADGEKPDRDRDKEFEDWPGERGSLMSYFDSGWQAFMDAIESINDSNVNTTIYIRGEAHSIQQALERSIAHLAYHVGQINMIARMVHQGQWNWLTIPPGQSAQHNKRTWGTSASRSVFGSDSGSQTDNTTQQNTGG